MNIKYVVDHTAEIPGADGTGLCPSCGGVGSGTGFGGSGVGGTGFGGTGFGACAFL